MEHSSQTTSFENSFSTEFADIRKRNLVIQNDTKQKLEKKTKGIGCGGLLLRILFLLSGWIFLKSNFSMYIFPIPSFSILSLVY